MRWTLVLEAPVRGLHDRAQGTLAADPGIGRAATVTATADLGAALFEQVRVQVGVAPLLALHLVDGKLAVDDDDRLGEVALEHDPEVAEPFRSTCDLTTSALVQQDVLLFHFVRLY